MNVALIATDNKKKLMENICIAYRHLLHKHQLFATGTTGSIIEASTGLNVHKYLAGHLGGKQQIATQISHNDIDLVIFLRDTDNMSLDIHDNEILSACDFHNIPIATNLATAEVLMLALDRGDFDWRNFNK